MSNPRACQPLKVKALAPVVRDLTPEYEGPYTIEPSSQSSVVVPVQGKKMTQDLTVERATLEELNVNITENGETRIEAEEGYLGLSGVNLTTNVQPALQTKSVEYTANGSYEVTADTEYYGLSRVNVTVALETLYEKDVNFYDYEGTLLYSYSKNEFLGLSNLPPLPSRPGLICQGWNWTLEAAQEYARDYGLCDIGAIYITNDGKTRIYFTLGEGRLSPWMGLGVKGTANIDWGDGTNENVSGSNLNTIQWVQHNYSQAGDYMIALTAPSGEGYGIQIYSNDSRFGSILLTNRNSISQSSNRMYCDTINKIEIGNNIYIGNLAFAYLHCLKEISIPYTANFVSANSSFVECISLSCIIIPFTSSAYALFQNLYSLIRVVFPYNFSGNLNFGGASSIQKIIVPPNVTQIGSLKDSHALKTCVIPNKTLTITGSCFQYCYCLESAMIYPNITVSGNAFEECQSMKSFVISEGVTSIGNANILRMHALTSLTFPSTMTNLGTWNIYECYSLGEIIFKSTIPPTSGSSNNFQNLPTDCKIYVPQASLDAYKTATNYPNPNTYTYVGY